LESINSNVNSGMDILSTSPDSYNRPGTAMSLDPSNSSYNSTSTTLLGGADSTGARSRAISNVSYGSDPASNPQPHRSGIIDSNTSRPFTPSSAHPSLLGVGFGSIGNREVEASQREANADESKLVTETVGRMLQCMSVLSSVGLVAGAGSTGDEEAQAKMEELCKALKLNWLGRGRTGRNRRGFVGTKIKREQQGATSML